MSKRYSGLIIQQQIFDNKYPMDSNPHYPMSSLQLFQNICFPVNWRDQGSISSTFYTQLLRAQIEIPNRQKDSQVISVFLHFKDLTYSRKSCL